MSTADQRGRMARAIVNYEARRDSRGHIQVYHPPANDGGGAFEVAGINVRYHALLAHELKALIEAGRHAEAEAEAVRFVADYTDVVVPWLAPVSAQAAIEFYLRDCVFNRGPKGAARILQRALGVPDDGEVGPVTRAAMLRLSPSQFVDRLRAAREAYEREVVGVRENLWHGLVNRWDKALAAARKFATEAAPAPQPPVEKLTTAQSPRSGSGAGLLRIIIDLIFSLFRRTPDRSRVQAPPREPRWLVESRKDIGFRERGTNLGIEQFIDEAHAGRLGDPWCAIFVNAKLEECGIPGTRSAMARSFEHHKNFVRLDGPALGAIATFWRGSPSAGTGHVNFYAGTLADGRHVGVGGNQSDRVSAAVMDMTRHTGWWWPNGEPRPGVGTVRIHIADPRSEPGAGTAAAGSET